MNIKNIKACVCIVYLELDLSAGVSKQVRVLLFYHWLVLKETDFVHLHTFTEHYLQCALLLLSSFFSKVCPVAYRENKLSICGGPKGTRGCAGSGRGLLSHYHFTIIRRFLAQHHHFRESTLTFKIIFVHSCKKKKKQCSHGWKATKSNFKILIWHYTWHIYL